MPLYKGLSFGILAILAFSAPAWPEESAPKVVDKHGLKVREYLSPEVQQIRNGCFNRIHRAAFDLVGPRLASEGIAWKSSGKTELVSMSGALNGNNGSAEWMTFRTPIDVMADGRRTRLEVLTQLFFQATNRNTTHIEDAILDRFGDELVPGYDVTAGDLVLSTNVAQVKVINPRNQRVIADVLSSDLNGKVTTDVGSSPAVDKVLAATKCRYTISSETKSARPEKVSDGRAVKQLKTPTKADAPDEVIELPSESEAKPVK